MENEHKQVLEALKTIAPILNEKALDYGEACSDRQVTDYMLHRYYEMADISKKIDAAILFLERTQSWGIRWQPIEAAPKVDGQRLCLALWDDDNYLCWITVGWWDKKRRAWWHNPDGRLIPPPSHWSPLPSGEMEIFQHETASEDTVEALIDFKRLMEGEEFLVDFIANHEKTIRRALGDPTIGIEVKNER